MAIVLVIVVSLIVGNGFLSRHRFELKPWHQNAPVSEFRAEDGEQISTLEDYLNLEQRLIAEISKYHGDKEEASKFMRYGKTPEQLEILGRNWNWTFELVPEKPRGGVLLLHGLTDSPYSMRKLAELYFKQGFYVLVLRIPGHGTVPAALLNISWRDWYAAAELGASAVMNKIGDLPFLMVGYSTGGALALKYAATSVEQNRRVPDGLVLLSPAVGITELSRVSTFHKLISWLPYFESAKWLDIEPEYDPYKYLSFPKNAGAQVFKLSKDLQRQLISLSGAGAMNRFPPVLTFQSVVDATIIGRACYTYLYSQVVSNGSELVVYDINHIEGLRFFFGVDTRAELSEAEGHQLPFNFTMLTNSGDAHRLVLREHRVGELNSVDRPLKSSWPAGVYSMSHVSIPFAPDDPIYGLDENSALAAGFLPIGTLRPLGEKGVLRISANELTRLRYNPFHELMLDKITSWTNDVALKGFGSRTASVVAEGD